MRITIESEGERMEVQPYRDHAAAAGPGDEALASGAINAGPPPEELVAAIAAAEGGADASTTTDAGPAPAE